MRLKLAPLSTLALFFTNILPSLFMLIMWTFKFYVQVLQSELGSLTSYNPFDLLSRVSSNNVEGTGHHRRRHVTSADVYRVAESGEETKELRKDGEQRNMLRQSSRFGAMSRFDSIDEDNENEKINALRTCTSDLDVPLL